MSAYLKFFELEQSPFEGRAQSQVVLGTRALRDAFGRIRTGLEEGASRLCVSGGSGLGKTSLARALPKLLGDEARVATILDPSVPWADYRTSLARQWGIAAGGLARSALVEARADRPLVLVIDQAERADEEFLDHLDVLLSYRTEQDTPVVQSVLLANLDSREGEAPPALMWWLDRIQTLQLEFAPLPRDGVASYVTKHLRRAGWRGSELFSEDAGHAIHAYTGGIPGEISRLCERLLVEAASCEQTRIDAAFVHAVCDPEPVGAEADAIEDDAGTTESDASTTGSDASTTELGATAGEDTPSADDDEAPWTLPDEFEALVGEGDFANVEAPPATAGRAEPSEVQPDGEPDLEAALRYFETAALGESAPRATDADDKAGAPGVTDADDTGGEPRELVADDPTSAERDDFDRAEASLYDATGITEPKAEPIELSDVVAEHDEASEEPSGISGEGEAEAATGTSARERDGVDAAVAPDPESDEIDPVDREWLDGPVTAEELAALRGGVGFDLKRLAGVAIAAAIGGLAIVSFGGNDEEATPQRTPPSMVDVTPAAPPLAEPARGFIDPSTLEGPAKAALEEALAAVPPTVPAPANTGRATRPGEAASAEPRASLSRTRENTVTGTRDEVAESLPASPTGAPEGRP